MNFVTVFGIVIITYHILYVIRLFFKNNREQVKTKNIQLEKMRNNKIKTLEDQKKFLDVKYPKSGGKIKFKDVIKIILKILIFIILFRTILQVFIYYNWEFNWWIGIIFIFGFPFLFNFIMKKFKLQQDNTLEAVLK